MDPEAELVARARRGDQRACAELVLRYQSKVVSMVYRMVGNRDVALELSQEVFLKIFNALDQYEADSSFNAWIRAIAANHAIDYLRRPHPHMTPLDPDGPEQPSAAPQPLSALEQEERHELVNRALAALPLGYRLPLWLHVHDELPYAEIAAVVNLPVSTVKVRIHRGIKLLQTAVQRLMGNEP